MADLSTSIAGFPLPSCIINASGPYTVTPEELHAIGASASGAILMKSCTIEPRKGNEEPRYWVDSIGSINSMGLPNLGFERYVSAASELKGYGKPVIASVAGLAPEDFPRMVEAFQRSDADCIEVNLSCPNVKGKPQIAYDFEKSDEILASIMNIGPKPIGVKLPPYFDFEHFSQMADVLKRHPISFITCINSIGNALIIDPETEQPVLRPRGGFGGLGGSYIKPTALGNVRRFRTLLPESIQIMGVGGIRTGTDVFEFLLAGADAVQIGTCFMEEGASCFARIAQELDALLQKKGYATARQVVGTLKEMA